MGVKRYTGKRIVLKKTAELKTANKRSYNYFLFFFGRKISQALGERKKRGRFESTSKKNEKSGIDLSLHPPHPLPYF